MANMQEEARQGVVVACYRIYASVINPSAAVAGYRSDFP
jgi:hypothetical protein